VTSAHALRRRHIANLLVTADQTLFAETMEHPGAPNGTGDSLTALYAGHLAGGAAPGDALRRATAATCDLVLEARRRGLDELPIVAAQDCLVQPRTEPQSGELKI
jgi:pyridoxine kinase